MKKSRFVVIYFSLFILHSSFAFSQAPTWSLNASNFQYQSTITAVVEVDFVGETDANNKLAAFKGSEIRGVANPISVAGKAFYFLQIYSNVISDTLELKLYDASSDSILTLRSKWMFTDSQTLGSIENPVALQFIYQYNFPPTWKQRAQNIQIESGSALPSINLAHLVTDEENDALGFSVTGNSSIGVEFSQQGIATLSYPTNFTGSENLIFTVFETANPTNLSRDTVSVTITAVDAPPQALSNGTFTAFGGETFSEINLLNYFTSPDGNAFRFSAEPTVPETPVARPNWSVNAAAFELNMNITAEIDFYGQRPAGNNLLGAFIGNELRGVASPQTIGEKTVYFLTVFANTNGETIHFRFWHEGSGSLKTATNSFLFSATTSGGSIENPFQTRFGGVTLSVSGTNMTASARTGFSGTESIVITATETGTANQFSVQTTFSFDVKTITRPRFLSLAGQIVTDNEPFTAVNLTNSITNEGNHPVSFSVKTLSGDALEASINAQNVLSVVPKTPESLGVSVFQIRVARTDFPEAADSISVRFERKASYFLPQPFALVFPGIDQTLDTTRFTFRWASVLVSDGRTATYTLRIQPDGGGSIVIRGLSTPEYTLDGTEGIFKNVGYTWWVTVSDGLYSTESFERRRFGIGIQVANEEPSVVPSKTALHQNYPNPFNPTTQIRFELEKSSHIRLEILDLNGRSVALLANGIKPAGAQEIRFDAQNLASGIYLSRLSVEGKTYQRKLTLMK